jgi:hypothetical protein
MPVRRDVQQEFQALREKLLRVLSATIWKPLERQPVSIIKPGDRFPAAYEFECDLSIEEIANILIDSELWQWDLFQIAGEVQSSSK